MEYHTTFLSLPEGRRIIAVSDIHGHLSLLKALLEKIRYKPGDDLLFLVGDTVEKGPDSLGTLRYVMKLCEEGTVYPTMGNVDAFTLSMLDADGDGEAFLRYVNVRRRHSGSSLITEALDELGLPLGGLSDVPAAKQALRAHLARETAFLQSLPALIETEKYIFVHGGLPEGAPEDWDGWKCMKNDDFLGQGRAFDKWVVVGHWPVMLYGADTVCANPIIERERRIISIDGGCVLKDDGQLNALVIPYNGSEDFGFEYYDPFPRRRVKSAQRGSEESVYIRWGDNVVEVLERGEEFSRCVHVRTGYELDILTKYLYGESGEVRCNDCTDYVLPLEAGDKVSVIETTSRGYLVKHEGVSGWYYGELE